MKKTPKKEIRLQMAKEWIQTYPGINLVKGYSKMFGVDKLCAVKELRMIGVFISEAYEKALMSTIEFDKKQKLAKKKKKQEEMENSMNEPLFESDYHYAMIVGYTSGGFAYGITHEEMEKLEKKYPLPEIDKK
jgi:hypothetical protein